MNRRRKSKVQKTKSGIFTAVILLTLAFLLWMGKAFVNDRNNENVSISEPETSVNQQEDNCKNERDETNSEEDIISQKMSAFARKHQFSINEYPDELVELLHKNPETEEFVLNYPLKKNIFSEGDLIELNQDEIPLLMQWDSRWGYFQYGDNVMGLNGCGPTCLSMVASYLLQNPKLTPVYIANYAMRNGYYVSGIGTSWDFMSDGAASLGLRVKEVPLMENKIKSYLQQGYPIICIMGPGEFTDNGHFIVLSGLEDDKIRLNDPNSRERSERLWEFYELKSQIRNIWVYEA